MEWPSWEDHPSTCPFGSPVSRGSSSPPLPLPESGKITALSELSFQDDFSMPAHSTSPPPSSPMSRASNSMESRSTGPSPLPSPSPSPEDGGVTPSMDLCLPTAWPLAPRPRREKPGGRWEDHPSTCPFGSPVSTGPLPPPSPPLSPSPSPESGKITASSELSFQDDFSMPAHSTSPPPSSPMSRASNSMELRSWEDCLSTGPFVSCVSTEPSPLPSPSPSPEVDPCLPTVWPPAPRSRREKPGGRKAICIRTDAQSFSQVVQWFTGLESAKTQPPLAPISPRSSIGADLTALQSTLPQERGVVGRGLDKQRIMDSILSSGGQSGGDRIKLVCITAADGLGKTTLASLVYRDAAVRGGFDVRGWVCLSEIGDYLALLRSAVESLSGVPCGRLERDELEETFRDELVGKKFLLVLDNVCDSNLEAFGDLLPLLGVGDKGSAVMVTTQSDMVAGFLGTRHCYQLEPLMQDSFLLLAQANTLLSSALVDIISSKVPFKCSGVAMFAKVIRGILRSIWQFDDVISRIKLVEIMSSGDNLPLLLRISHACLPPCLQRCFAFCSLFPKDYTFNKEMLHRLWMSQGFIQTEEERDLEAFEELVQRSLFDYSPSCDVKEEMYVMHELISDLARSVSGDNTFFKARDHELHLIPKDVRHLSLDLQQYDSDISFRSFIGFRDLSTFILVNNCVSRSMDSQLHVENLDALDELFWSLRCLRTLDLSHTDIKELPESIGNLSQLRYLGLNNTSLRRLPNSVCNLSNLQTLELQNSVYLAELPMDIKNLANLCHLDVWKESGIIYVPPGIGRLANLQTLTAFTVGGVSWNCDISELASLSSLKGSLCIQGLENVNSGEDATRARLAEKHLKKLSLEWCHSGEAAMCNDRMFAAERVLHVLAPNYMVSELIIKGYYGREFPNWLSNQFLSKLISLTLDNCYQCETLPPLGGLPNLKYLFIQKLSGVRVIDSKFCGFDNMVFKKFPRLEMLKLWDMYHLEHWGGVMDGDFPSLRSLLIGRCPKLTIIPSFECLSDLSVQPCSKLELLCLQSLQTLKIGSLKHRKCLFLPKELHELRMLEVTCCDHLSSIEGLTQLQSLKELQFRSCPELSFSQEGRLPNALQIVVVHHNCYSLRNWRPIGFKELADASQVRRKFIKDSEFHDSDTML